MPKIVEDLYWIVDNKQVNIIMENKGIMNFLMQKLIKKPRTSIIHLDEIGSFVWQKIDGYKTIEEIAVEIENEFGKSVTPLHKRLEKYFDLLCRYNFVILKK